MTYYFFTVLMEMHKTDPETVELFLDDPEFRRRVMRNLEAHGKSQGLLDAAIAETLGRDE